MDKLSILIALIVIFIFLILAMLTSIVLDLGSDIHLETVKCYQMLSEIQRINENIYFKLDEF